MTKELEEFLGESCSNPLVEEVEAVDALSDDDDDEELHHPLAADIVEHLPPGARSVPTMEDSTEFRRRAAMNMKSIDINEISELLAIRVPSASWCVHCLGTGSTLGRIRPIRLHLLQMSCQIPGHRSCKLMLKAEVNYRETEAALLKWLLCGVSLKSSERHMAMGEPYLRLFNRVD